MEVTIKYNDDTSLTVEEVVKHATVNYGKNARVEVLPDSAKPHDLIYFAIQCIITNNQISLLYDDKLGYNKSIKTLRAETLSKLEELLDQVIVDNETRIL